MNATLRYGQDFTNGLQGKYLKVMQHIPPRSRVLELGCSYGYFSRILKDAGHTVVGIEYDDNMRAIAEQIEGITVLPGNLEAPDFLTSLSQSFDVVLAMDILEHLRNPEVVLQALQPCFSPQGRLLITGPNVAFWGMRRDLLLGRWTYTDAGVLDRTHLRFFNASGWRELAEINGYTVDILEPADIMLPFEKYVPSQIKEKNLNLWRLNGAKVAPNLFSITFFLQAHVTDR